MNNMLCSTLNPWIEFYEELFGFPHCKKLGDILAKQEFPPYTFILYLDGAEELPEVRRLGLAMGFPETSIVSGKNTKFHLHRTATEVRCSECGLIGHIVSVREPLYPVEVILSATMNQWLARKLSSTTGELVDIAV